MCVIFFILIKLCVEEKFLYVYLKNLFDRNFCIEKKDKKMDRKKNICNFSFFFILYVVCSSIVLIIYRLINMGINMDKFI